ncbi:unnamed protein product [Lupinus luteus]|uniref:Uncharacterized protein n=1 Tax=Lupinus luteus TaxID=3873 RepID=A0AAV1Y4Y1_LUPLU
MRCNKHISDLTSTIGICATCLHQRLTSLLQAQAQAQAQTQQTRVTSRSTDECSIINSNTPPPPPLILHRSVSLHGCDRREKLFRGSPQICSRFYGDGKRWKKRLSKLWNFSTVFRFKSEKFRSDPSCEKSSSASPSCFSTLFQDCRKNRDRFGDECNKTTSGSGCLSESSPRWRRTASATAATNLTRRSRLGLKKSVSDSSGMANYLTPLVSLNNKGMLQRSLTYPKRRRFY